MKKRNALGLIFFSFLFFTCAQLRTLEDSLHSKFPPKPRPEKDEDGTFGGASKNSRVFPVFPVSGRTRRNIISGFGDPRGGGTRLHEGIDIDAALGTPVRAVADGIVTKVKEGGNGGKQVWVEDKKRGYTYYYAHLNSQSVRQGERVRPGTELGTVGKTGNARSPHLHFGIYEPGQRAIDPMPMMP